MPSCSLYINWRVLVERCQRRVVVIDQILAHRVYIGIVKGRERFVQIHEVTRTGRICLRCMDVLDQFRF